METIMALCWSESIDGWFDVFLVRGYLNLCLYAGIDSKWRERKNALVSHYTPLLLGDSH